MRIRGNPVPDARVAAVLETNGIVTIYTNDRDFRKSPGLTRVDARE